MPSSLDPKQHFWLLTPGLRRIFEALKAAGGEARCVGGCVRDALLGRPVNEVDLACTLPPDKSSDTLKKAGLKISPTGIEHGTITAIADHKGYEITTLRRDVETFGRKAKVEFTDDWQADAARRDFTMNALYADADGNIYDYFNGREDLARHHVRFIGKAEERIKEDVLRILRFFRFYAWFGKGKADAEGLKACAALAAELPKLSVERIWNEVKKLLAAENPAPSWRLLIEHKILPHFLPEADNIARLEGLLTAEKKFDAGSSSLARLAALLPANADKVTKVSQKLKMSKCENDFLYELSTLPDRIRGQLDPVPFRRMLYYFGPELCRDAALLVAASDGNVHLEPALAEEANWQKPVFPLQGEDLLQLGLKPGPKIGKILHTTEEWWISSDFRPSHDECLAEAKRHLHQ